MAPGPYLLLITVAAIGFLLALILIARMHAFLALFITSMALGLAAGMPAVKVLKSMQTGFGDALGFIAVVIGLGAMIGRFLEDSGGGRALADWLLLKSGRDYAQWAVLVAAFLVGLPVFFEVGFVILVPLAWSVARESKRSVLLYALPLAAAMTILHALVPPHPAPSVAAQLLGADVGRIIIYGIILSVPLMILGGIIYGKWISKLLPAPVAPTGDANGVSEISDRCQPSVAIVVIVLVLPVILIFIATLADYFHAPGKEVYDFIGHPFTALLLSVLTAMLFLGLRRGQSPEQITKAATKSLAPIATLLLIIGGGGALKQIIVDSGVGAYAGKELASSSISPLLVCFVTAAGLRAAQGSATVAIVTAAGILAPLMKQFAHVSPELLVLAVSCGGTSISHVNDAGFWLVKEYLGLSVADTLKSWSVMKLIMGVAGIVLVMLAQAVFF
ncbi:MAG TPA: gluconate:H+ symporter [Bryobacteraceae bacterium]|nr:gluconate:H+ symporter [Bryobacteraceae bacterium]